ncbi:hypothetical protein D2E25_1713 [Bifidobacterium goeldii]|uniref:5-bromo-4-chloroindolyl phosphate hydrolysis protein n=1 Tax=Bifidobacterium goeldii TaxID=2306975 RepID=A0A430FG84_9BIFI|nr:5-bromo-4-chloroindolyl phosphate hydrolysis family protein [Bifidobacterium goeldii]RSX51738.1 hypothetical protein D2E25_1713 [Bifidobacterium goeldii]
MLSIIAGFLAGFAVGAVAFVLIGGGVPGLIVGAIAATAGYVAVSSLTERSRRIGSIAVELVPDGDKALAAIDQANARLKSISALRSRIIDMRVKAEADDFIAATNDLIRYVGEDPHSYPTLNHFINVYGEQTESLLNGYLDVERSGVTSQMGQARTEAIEALQALERTAAGELTRAVKAKTLALSADSDAIVRLSRMDGYDSDNATAAIADAGDSANSGDSASSSDSDGAAEHATAGKVA